ncbi:hypothetical protein CJ030_MR3G012309 [Morella rubra]|uniref:Late embryogenesis abundant protein LEA-2 subgroup domain-containing protein n=1 Tax=Morella rubra TaxID=262757 RepID=A0A6A1W3N2_9ROSI|nr:hypothetical protein CJ030_MR3G012309 [Morella rubra]
MGDEQLGPRPLIADGSCSDDEDAAANLNQIRRTKWVKYGCRFTTCMLILSVIAIVISLTVFNIQDPNVKMTVVKATKLELMYRTIPKPGTNMSVVARSSVENPNMFSFIYNTTITLYYHENMVGQAQGPSGQAKPLGTETTEVTVDVSTDRLISYPNVNGDVSSGLLNMSSYSTISGQVEVFKGFKKRFDLRSTCTVTFNISSQAVQEQNCKS